MILKDMKLEVLNFLKEKIIADIWTWKEGMNTQEKGGEEEGN